MPLNFLCCFSRESNRQDEGEQSSENNTNDEMIPAHHPNQHLGGFGGARPRDSSAYPTVVISSNSSNSSSSSSRGSSQSPHQSVIYHPTAIGLQQSSTPVPPTTFNIGNMTAQEEEIYFSTLISQTRNNINNNNNITPDEVSDIATIASTSLNENHEEEGDDEEKFYSFQCLVCYKSEIPKQVILPCGHSQCCETCFNQMQKRYRRTRRYHLKTLQKESIRPGHDIHCPTCRQDGILCHLFLGEEDLTSEIIPHIQDRSSSLTHH